MSSAFERKKDPDGVRRALLDSTARLAVEQGLGAVTLSAVAMGAGVTKGGLFHHFPNKQALVTAMFQELLDHFDAAIAQAMETDTVEHGRFTRAYVRAVFADEALGKDNPSARMSLVLLTDQTLLGVWSAWLAKRVNRYAATDANALCEVVRLAADGVWLAALTPPSQTTFDAKRALDQMITLTYAQA